MYYVLGRSWAEHPARLPDRGSYDDQGIWWNDGHRFTQPIKTPLEIKLEPYEARSPEQSPQIPQYIPGLVPFFSDSLVAAFHRAQVNNFDVYEARVFDPDNGQYYQNYKAVNILGMVGAADMTRSQAIVHDGIPLIDVSFDSLTIDPQKAMRLPMFRLAENNNAILIHERVRAFLMNEGFVELEFYQPENIAL